MSNYSEPFSTDKALLSHNFFALALQNIDTLEHVAGIPAEKVVEAHGTFNSATCRNADCHESYPQAWIKGKTS